MLVQGVDGIEKANFKEYLLSCVATHCCYTPVPGALQRRGNHVVVLSYVPWAGDPSVALCQPTTWNAMSDTRTWVMVTILACARGKRSIDLVDWRWYSMSCELHRAGSRRWSYCSCCVEYQRYRRAFNGRRGEEKQSVHECTLIDHSSTDNKTDHRSFIILGEPGKRGITLRKNSVKLFAPTVCSHVRDRFIGVPRS